MAPIQRPSVQADIGAIPVDLSKPFAGIMATLAEAHERSKPELVDVAVMWLDVIADCRRLDDAALEAEHTQRVFAQLVPTDPGPARL
jgi:hypothetical protein